eukprot:gene11057-19915_t
MPQNNVGRNGEGKGDTEVLISYPLKESKSPPEVLIMYQKLDLPAADARGLDEDEYESDGSTEHEDDGNDEAQLKGYCGDNPRKPIPAHNVAETGPVIVLRPEGSEWLRWPHVAAPELASTINNNLPVLDADLALLDERKLASFKQNI